MKQKINIPPTYLYICMLFSLLPILFLNKLRIVYFPYNLIGIILVFIGSFLTFRSMNIFKKNNTPHNFDKSTKLVSDGLYKYSRNPMYLGMIIILFGIAFTAGNIISFISPVFYFLIINYKFIPYEEKKMMLTFKKDYIEYKKKVRRWL